MNLANIDHAKSPAPVVPSNTGAGREASAAVDSDGLPIVAETFKDSIKKITNDARHATDDEEVSDGSGNNMPVSEVVPEVSDRHLSQDQSKLTDELLASTESMSTDDNNEVMVALSSQLRYLTQDSATDRKAVKAETMLAVDARKTSPIVSEKTLLQTEEILPQDTVPVVLKAPVNFISSSVSGQQQLLTTAQTSPLQTLSSPVEPHIESLHVMASAPVNSFSTINLQSLPQPVIMEAFGRPAWSQGMAKQILLMVNQNIGTAEIRLNPAHLGPIEILIDMREDQVNVSMSSRHASVREAMEQALPRLREMLQENGFNLADTDISKHSFAEKSEQDAEKSHNNASGESGHESMSSEINESIIQKTMLASGIVDYYI
jgi:flagellar hook-length control protein FliK